MSPLAASSTRATFTADLTGGTCAGTAGYIGLGAQVTLITDDATEDAFIGGGASAASRSLAASHAQRRRRGRGGRLARSPDAAIAHTTLGGSTTPRSAPTGQARHQVGSAKPSSVGAVTVHGDRDGTATANATAVAAGAARAPATTPRRPPAPTSPPQSATPASGAAGIDSTGDVSVTAASSEAANSSSSASSSAAPPWGSPTRRRPSAPTTADVTPARPWTHRAPSA